MPTPTAISLRRIGRPAVWIARRMPAPFSSDWMPPRADASSRAAPLPIRHLALTPCASTEYSHSESVQYNRTHHAEEAPVRDYLIGLAGDIPEGGRKLVQCGHAEIGV